MIDIHNHILPAFDDGAKSFEDSLEMAKQAVDQGISILFATPHVSLFHEYENSPRIADAVNTLQHSMDEQGLKATIIPGAEVFPSSEMLPNLDRGLPITLGTSGKYILLDMPLSGMPLDMEELVYELQTRAITPILAHPERSAPIQKDPRILEELVHNGLLLQINASSLIGHNGEGAKTTAFKLLDQQWVQFIASDAHSPRRRPSRMAMARNTLSDILSAEAIENLVTNNGRRVIDGEVIPTNPRDYVHDSGRNLITRFFSRFIPQRH